MNERQDPTYRDPAVIFIGGWLLSTYDLRLGFRAGRITFKYIAGQLLSQCFRNLTAAGIMDADKGYFLHFIPPIKGHRLPMH